VQITVDIPDELATQIASGHESLSRVALEALALEGYRNQALSEAQVRQMLGFETRMEVHAFLKAHGAWMHYSTEDADRDLITSRNARQGTPKEAARR
jgi:hypothetical protein